MNTILKDNWNTETLSVESKYLKILGNFQWQIPEKFWNTKVYDLRDKKTNIWRWWYIDYPWLNSFFVILDPVDNNIYGDFISGEQFLKWSNSIRLRVDIIMAWYSRWIDSSWSWMHGTQNYQYLATRKYVRDAVLELTVPVKSWWYWKTLPENKDFSLFKTNNNYEKFLRVWDILFTHILSHKIFIKTREPLFQWKLSSVDWYEKSIHESFTLKSGDEFIDIEEPTIEWIINALKKVWKLTKDLEILLAKEKLLENKSCENVKYFISILCKYNYIENIDQKEEDPKIKMDEIIETGEILHDFGWHFRLIWKSNQANYWVIQPDGTFREADEIIYKKFSKEEGDKRWYVINPDEIAISWSKDIIWADHICNVLKSTDNPTDAQIQTIKNLEEEINQIWVDISINAKNPSPLIWKWWDIKKT